MGQTTYFTKSSRSRWTSFRNTKSDVGNIAQNATKFSHLHVTPSKCKNWNMKRRSHSSPLSLILQFACQRSMNRTNHWSSDVNFLVSEAFPFGSGSGCPLPKSFRMSSGISSQNSASSAGSSEFLTSSYKTKILLYSLL